MKGKSKPWVLVTGSVFRMIDLVISTQKPLLKVDISKLNCLSIYQTQNSTSVWAR